MQNTPAYQAYVDLLKRSLGGTLNPENGLRISYLLKCMDTSTPYDLQHVIHINQHEAEALESLAVDPNGQHNYRERVFGFPFSMIGQARMDHLQMCIEQVVQDGVPGDFLEAGVWRGGAAILMKGIGDLLGQTQRRVWVADSFQGVPVPSYAQDESVDLYLDPSLAIPQQTVAAHFARFGLLDERVRFLEGWFKDTLPTAPVESLAVLRADGDLYESTMDVLTALYDKVSPGGYIIIDDYGALECCRQATEDFRAERGIVEPIQTIDWTGAWWRKC